MDAASLRIHTQVNILEQHQLKVRGPGLSQHSDANAVHRELTTMLRVSPPPGACLAPPLSQEIAKAQEAAKALEAAKDAKKGGASKVRV